MTSPIEKVETCSRDTLAAYDEIIDVRSPSEFAEDHIPGAVNLPSLSNDERAEIGTIYKQVSRFEARRRGAAYVAANVARHLDTHLADKQISYRPLVYCWRGGMRSSAFATILANVGWRTDVIARGYRTWRTDVVSHVRDSEAPLNIILIDGPTGAGKTKLLNCLDERGAQTIDLERIAAHRGSVFGAIAGIEQPSQKLFESLIYDQIRQFDIAAPIFVEAESNRIGRCEIPGRLWRAMTSAPSIKVSVPIDKRAQYLCSIYLEKQIDRAVLASAIDRLRPFQPNTIIDNWNSLLSDEDYLALACGLMEEHYDKAYGRTQALRNHEALATLDLNAIDKDAIDAAAQTILKIARNAA